MQKELSLTTGRTACNGLPLRQAARHISLIYDSYQTLERLRTTQFSIPAKRTYPGSEATAGTPAQARPSGVSAVFLLRVDSRASQGGDQYSGDRDVSFLLRSMAYPCWRQN